MVLLSFGKIHSVDSGSIFSGFKYFEVSTFFIPCSSIVFIWISKALPRGENLNFACSFIILWSHGNISSHVRYYLPILPDDSADIFAASLLISYCNFSSLILTSIFMISYYIRSKRFFLKGEESSDAGVVSITKKE